MQVIDGILGGFLCVQEAAFSIDGPAVQLTELRVGYHPPFRSENAGPEAEVAWTAPNAQLTVIQAYLNIARPVAVAKRRFGAGLKGHVDVLNSVGGNDVQRKQILDIALREPD